MGWIVTRIHRRARRSRYLVSTCAFTPRVAFAD